MSYGNDGFNTTSQTTGRNEGFMDSNRGTESYGSGPAAGVSNSFHYIYHDPDHYRYHAQAFDPANTGLGGYGTSQQRSSDTSGIDSYDSNRATGGGTGNNFDSDNNMSSGTGGAFGRDRGMEKPSFTGTDSQFGNTETGATFNRNRSNDNDFNAGSSGLDDIQSRDRDRERDFDTSGSGPRNDQFGGESQREREGGKPTFGDKMRGTSHLVNG